MGIKCQNEIEITGRSRYTVIKHKHTILRRGIVVQLVHTTGERRVQVQKCSMGRAIISRERKKTVRQVEPVGITPSASSATRRHIKSGGERRNAFYFLCFFKTPKGNQKRKADMPIHIRSMRLCWIVGMRKSRRRSE